MGSSLFDGGLQCFVSALNVYVFASFVATLSISTSLEQVSQKSTHENTTPQMLIPWWSVLQGLQHQLRHQPIWWSNKLVWSTCIHHQLAPSPLLLAHRSITTPANHNPLLIVHPGCTNEYQRQEAARLATTYSGMGECVALCVHTYTWMPC